MKKNVKIILIVILILIAIAFVYFISIQERPGLKDLSKITNQEIIEILKKDKDINSYTQKYPDFKIENKEILAKESILAGQNAENFREIYQDLELEDNRYLKVQLMDLSGSNGFFGVIDFKNNSVVKSFGILLFKTSAGAVKK